MGMAIATIVRHGTREDGGDPKKAIRLEEPARPLSGPFKAARQETISSCILLLPACYSSDHLLLIDPPILSP